MPRSLSTRQAGANSLEALSSPVQTQQNRIHSNKRPFTIENDDEGTHSGPLSKKSFLKSVSESSSSAEARTELIYTPPSLLALPSTSSLATSFTESSQSQYLKEYDDAHEDIDTDLLTLELPTVEPPHKPFLFQPDMELFDAAKAATSGMSSSYWSYKLYRGPHKETVKAFYGTTLENSERIAKMFLNEEVLGFDMEWKMYATADDEIKSNVSVIQLASETKIGVFHIALFRGQNVDDLVIPSLKVILENVNIRKTGVNIIGDARRLYRHLGIKAQSLVELSYHYNLWKTKTEGGDRVPKRCVALATQIQEHLGLPLFKEDYVRKSDWTRPLFGQRLDYATNDAYASIQLYDVLEGKRKALKPCPPYPPYAEIVNPLDKPSKSASPKPSTRKPRSPKPVSLKYPSPKCAYEEAMNAASAAAATAITLQESLTGAAASIFRVHAWMKEERGLKKNTEEAGYKSKPSELRSYALWHREQLEVADIANALRDPPLKQETVAEYILNCVMADKLPFERLRMDAVLLLKPEWVVKRRYSSLCA
jgi:hypothetical protein